MTPRLPIGTYSFFNQLINCPHKAFHIYVGRTIPYVESPEMAWGNQVHSAMENRIKFGSPLPDSMQTAEPTARRFHEMSKQLPIQVEYQLAMTQDGKPCDYRGDNVFFRGKLDLVTMNPPRTYAWMVDWKTGNVREDPFELETGALLLKVNQPTIDTITAEYFWMKTGQNGLRYTLNNHANTYDRIVKLRMEAESYFRAGEWPKKKNPLCPWCPVATCEHYKGGKGK